jgi:hypothetical protein
MKKVVVLVISHKAILSENEIKSLRQLYKILGHYPIKFIVPHALDVSNYAQVNENLEFKFIDPKWQSNYRQFNRLKIDPLIYKMFADYEYILFYEPDAWVFKDNLLEWCEKNYDYVGAPWFKTKPEQSDLEKAFLGVGNGGLSLRKVSTMLKVLHSFKYVHSYRQCQLFLDKQPNMTFIKKKLSLIKSFTISNNFYYLFNDFGNNEDYFWGEYVAKRFKWFTVPNMEEALKFSFEKRCEESFTYLNKELPFGCHAWWNIETTNFWKDYIK